MIIRISGGNDGVAEYLENGRKAEREFTRDELDHRLILDGNLDATNKIIQSIENTGQERYLHITLSFQENDVSHETIKAVTEEYKTLLMNAYSQDEYCFYAEAHLPKIKNITNNHTGDLVERKPHIHIVIPETNLVNGNKLLPTGKVTMTERYLDAIQEHVNYKYGLISPKDVSRVSDNNYANVLSRTKGDLFRERNSEYKKQILEGLTNNNITSFSKFGHYLINFGEVKLRNVSKDNQYYAVKFDGDSKFTNLKSPLFSQQYVEKRELPIVKPTEKQVSLLLKEWQQRVSHEVKHIYPKSESVRNAYKSLSDQEKKSFLKERIDSYEQERKYSPERGRKERHKRSIKQLTRPSLSRRANRLPYMPQRTLVYGIRGSSRQSEQEWKSARREASERLLSFDEHSHLGEPGTESIYVDQAMRRDNAGERPELARGIKCILESSVLHEELFQYINKKAQESEIETMREVRNNIDPERFLSVLSREFKIIASDYRISHTKDGSPRFQVGKRNMNASDFLTKNMNLSWIDSKHILLKIFSEQQAGLPFEKALTRRSLTKKQASDRFESLKETQKELKSILRLNRSSLYNEIKDLRNQIYQVRGNEREVARGLIVYHKLTGLETLSEIDKKGREFLTDYHAIWNEDKDPMKALQKLKEIINFSDEENGVEAAETTLSIKSRVDAQKRVQELQRTRLKDLVLQKSQDKLVFLNPESEKPVFTDKGMRLIANKDASNEETALMLEYAKEKFGGVLKLNGDDEFKKRCALIAAEKNMNIIIKPEEFNDLMKQHKADLVANQIQQGDAVQVNVEQNVMNGAEMSVEDVKAMLFDNEQRRMAMSDEQKQREFAGAAAGQENEVRAQINAEIIEARTGVTLDPASLVQDVIDAHKATLSSSEPQGIFNLKFNELASIKQSLLLEQIKENGGIEIKHFQEALESHPNSNILNLLQTANTIAFNEGNDYLYDPNEPVESTYALSNGLEQGVSNSILKLESSFEKRSLINDLINKYAQKAESEELEFFVRDIEHEITSKNMSLDETKEYLEKEIILMRTVKEDMHQDSENENVQD